MEQPIDSSYRFIPLTRGQWAIVDTCDYDYLMQWKWCAQWNPKNRSYYAIRNSKLVNRKRTLIWMHRVILGLEGGDPLEGDHALHNTLDNRRFVDGKENLRIASDLDQGKNHLMREDNTSGYTGAFFKKEGVYESYISIDGKRTYLGSRSTARAAHFELYVPAAKIHYGRFARPDLFEKEN